MSLRFPITSPIYIQVLKFFLFLHAIYNNFNPNTSLTTHWMTISTFYDLDCTSVSTQVDFICVTRKKKLFQMLDEMSAIYRKHLRIQSKIMENLILLHNKKYIGIYETLLWKLIATCQKTKFLMFISQSENGSCVLQIEVKIDK